MLQPVTRFEPARREYLDPDVPKIVLEAVPAHDVTRQALSPSLYRKPSGDFVKRIFDFTLGLLFLCVAAPLMAAISIMVATDGGAVFFRHSRLGKNLDPFFCLKFRTMIPGAEATLKEYLTLHPNESSEWIKDHKLSFDVRVTPVGRFLRKTSLDELPQLLNVVWGEMSLVGPRPVTDKETGRYGDILPLYASVRPGVTGLWQVSGRNDISYAGRVDMDRRYVQTRNTLRDLAILFVGTPRVLLSRKGAR